MKMAYIATDPKTNHCYAIASADPDFTAETLKDVKGWKMDGAIVELLPADEAKARFCEDCKKLADRIKALDDQQELFKVEK